MSFSEALEERICRRLGLDPQRTLRAIEFSIVGATGAVVDLVTTLALLGHVHYLIANTAGFLLAVSWNFGGNWWFVFDRPSGRLSYQYGSYVVLHAATFGLRAVVVATLVEAAGVPVTIATVVGIGVAAVANFLGTERIFDGLDQLWLDLVGALNHIAHVVYGSRLRAGLRKVGVYGVLYGCYQRVLGLLYRDDTLEIAGGPVSAVVHTEHPAETLSVLHTIEKEQSVLDRFVNELERDDVVWDVGANLGVFAVLAGQIVTDGQVLAFEPVAETTQRCRENAALNDLTNVTVFPYALGEFDGEASIALERAELGTQTPALDTAGERTVSVRRGSTFADDHPDATPSVVKIDVEGAEAEVLYGLDGMLSGVRVVLVELHGEERAAIEYRLRGAGFGIEEFSAGGQAYLIGRQPS